MTKFLSFKAPKISTDIGPTFLLKKDLPQIFLFLNSKFRKFDPIIGRVGKLSAHGEQKICSPLTAIAPPLTR